MSRSKLTIIVGGYIVGYPLGGMTWHHLNYLLGLHELGHEVWFYEHASWPPYNPQAQRCDWDAAYGTKYLQEQFQRYNLPPNWCYSIAGEWHNLSASEFVSLLSRADLMICVSGVTPLQSIDPRPRRMLVIDTDPVFTQLRMQHDNILLDYYKRFDAVATFGRLIGTLHCPLPTHGLNWIPTNQPVSLRHWPHLAGDARRPFTTIGKWQHASDRAVEFAGRKLASSKSIQWMKMIDLPQRVGQKLSVAMESMPADVRSEFESHGWQSLDAENVTRNCADFQEFVRNSAGEFTVAKEIYSEIPSGWFSDRSACYLACGRPVVTQSTGFESWLPTGTGLLSFRTIDEGASALADIANHYEHHAAAARHLATEYFDSGPVLNDLLDAVL